MNETFESFAQAAEYLIEDDDKCFSQWGSDSHECAPFAWVLALIFQRSSGDPIDRDNLDGCMSMVVNDHPDVEGLLSEWAESVGYRFDGESLWPADREWT